jgi:hypothetical protein
MLVGSKYNAREYLFRNHKGDGSIWVNKRQKQIWWRERQVTRNMISRHHSSIRYVAGYNTHKLKPNGFTLYVTEVSKYDIRVIRMRWRMDVEGIQKYVRESRGDIRDTMKSAYRNMLKAKRKCGKRRLMTYSKGGDR